MSKLYHNVFSTLFNITGKIIFGAIVLSAFFLFQATAKAQDNCLNFDGINDYVDLGNLSPVGNFSTGFSFMAKVKLGSFNNNSRIFDFGNGTALQNIMLSINGTTNGLSLSAYRDNYVPAKGTLLADNCLSLNVWTHIAVTITDNAYACIYVNGALISSGFARPPADAERTKCYLGKSNTLDDGYLNAAMDEVSIWSRPLTEEEVVSRSVLNLIGNEIGLYAYYKFNQGVAGAANPGITALLDATTNAKNGTLTNFDLNSSISNWIKNEAGNMFSRVPIPTLTGNVFGLTTGDYNNDGYLDILGKTPEKLIVFKNNKDLSFTEQTDILLPGGNNATRSDWVDFDNDNDLDIFITGSLGSEKIAKLFRNDGGNVFTELSNTLIEGVENGLTSWGDFDNDGDLDLLLSGVSSGYYPDSKIYRNNGDDTFTWLSDILIQGVYSSSGGWGDYDNDGDLDILLAGNTGNIAYTSIFRNDGNNKFVNSGISLPGSIGGTASWGDYDSDGDLDILLVGSDLSDTKIAKVYRNTGAGSFEEQTGIVLPKLIGASAKWGDYDSDGLMDILHIGFDFSNMSARIYRNNGNNSFSELPDKIIDVNSNAFCTGDFNNDDKLDYVTSLYINGNFQSFMFINSNGIPNPAPSAPTGLAVTFTDSTAVFSWNRVPGDATPENGLSYNLRIGTSPGATNIVTPAANESGKRYLPGFGNRLSDAFFVFKNPVPATFYWSVQAVDNSFAGGAFAAEIISEYSNKVQASGLRLGNLGGVNLGLKWKRGNGLACVVFGKKGNSGIAIPADGLAYAGNSVFGSGSEIGSDKWFCIYNGTADSVTVTGLDFVSEYIFQVMEYSPGSVYFSESLPTSILTTTTKNYSEVANLPAIYRSAQAWGDYDNDKDMDLISTGIINDVPVTKLYRNDGNYVFTEVQDHGITAVSDGAVAWGDYDNDGGIDLLISGLSSSGEITKVFRNNKNGTFSELTSSSFKGLKECAVEWADFDNDGDLDLIISGTNPSGSYTKIYKNNRNGSFTEPTVALPGAGAGDMVCGDYNNDGNIDILVTGGNITALYRNDGDFVFTLLDGTGLPLLNESTASWVDEDNDGYLDLFLSGMQNGWSNIAGLYHNNRNSTFSKTNQIFHYIKNCSVELADLNRDGFADIIIAGGMALNEDTSRVYFNNGVGSYILQADISFPDFYQGSLTAADIDANGTMELMLSGAQYLNQYNYFARLYSFHSLTGKIIPSKPGGLASAVVDNKNVRLSWDRLSDNGMDTRGVTYNVSIGKSLGGSEVKSGMAFTDGLRKIAGLGNCSDSSFTIKGLTPGKYYWSVQAVDNAFTGGIAAIDSFEFEAIQAINLKAGLLNTSGSIKLSWENGNGSQRIVFCKKGTEGNASPVNNTSYYADAEYGVGSQIGISGWYCVFNGRADSCYISGLLPGDEYLFEVMEYTGGSENQLYNQDFSGSNLGCFSSGVFSRKTTVNIDPGYTYRFVDLNADGYLDLLSSGDFVYLNKGNHNFQYTTLSSMGIPGGYESADFKLKPLEVHACADLNNDGYFDLMTRRQYEVLLPIDGSTSNFVWTRFYKSQVWMNDQNGSFVQSDSLACDGGYTNTSLSTDVDNDGDIDLLLVYKTFIQTFKNQGNGKFVNSGTLTTGLDLSFGWTYAKEGDINNDGKVDLVINSFNFSYSDTSRLKFFLNDGSGAFSFADEIIVTTSSFGLGDYDKDGDLDIIGAQSAFELNTEPSYIFRNEGSCVFSNQSQRNIKGGYSGHVLWMDYDSDGYPDILSSGLQNDYAFAKLYRNNKNGSFTEFSEVSLTGVTNGSSDFGDIDNDGDLDFLLTGRINTYGNEMTGAFYQGNIFANAGPYAVNRRPEAPLNPTTAIKAGGIQLKWDAVTTDETPEKAMSYNFRYRNLDSTTWLGNSMSSETGKRLIAAPGNLHLNNSVTMNLKEGTYIWQVQAIDGGYSASAWSEAKTFSTKATQAFFTADTVCRGIATQFTENSLSSNEIVGWEWDFGDASALSNLKNPAHLFVNSGVHTVKLIVTDSKAASDTIFGSVIVKDSPNVLFVADDVCEGTTASIDNQTTSGGVVITGWSWDFGDGFTSTLEEPVNHVYGSQNTYLMSLSVSSDNGCVGKMSRNVTVATRPNATISLEYGVPSFCLGDSVIYSALPNTNYDYHWLRDNEYITETTNVLKVKTISGDYRLEISNKTTKACSASSVVKTISVKNAPSVPEIAEATNNTLFCAGTIVELIVTNLNPDYTYQWKRSGVAIEQATQPTYQGRLSEGEYTVVAGTGNCGTSSETLILKNKQGPEKPKIFARGPNVWILICDNNTAREYRWYYNDQLISGAMTSQYIARQNLGEYFVEVNDGGECFTPSDIITIPIAKSQNGNPGVDSETITLYPNPTESQVKVELETLLPGTMDVELINSMGNLVARYRYENSAGFGIDMSAMPAGVYFCKIFYEEGIVIKKILKQ